MTPQTKTGRIAQLETLRGGLPPSVLGLLEIRGLGPRTAKLLFERLGVDSVERLEAICRSREILGVGGIREKTRENILNIASSALIFVPGGWGVYEAEQAGLGLGSGLAFMKFSRSFEAQADFLAKQGCDVLQGFLFARPMEPEAFLSFAQASHTYLLSRPQQEDHEKLGGTR